MGKDLTLVTWSVALNRKWLINLPWCGACGRDLDRKAAWLFTEDKSLLAETHWLLADHASQLLENAPLVLAERGSGLEVAMLDGFLQRLASAADTIVAALVHLAGHARLVALPEILQQKALCTGLQSDFAASFNSHQCVFAGCSCAAASLATLELLQHSRKAFLLEGLHMEPWTAERLRLQGLALQSGCGLPGGGEELLDAEWKLVQEWLGAKARTEYDPDIAALYILRRMWLCPRFGCVESDDAVDEENSCAKDPLQ